jgi:hypothetical protein
MSSPNTNIDEILKKLVADRYFPVKNTGKKLELIEEAKTQLQALLSTAKIQAYDEAIEDAITLTMGINDVAVARERIKRLLTKEKQ